MYEFYFELRKEGVKFVGKGRSLVPPIAPSVIVLWVLEDRMWKRMLFSILLEESDYP